MFFSDFSVAIAIITSILPTTITTIKTVTIIDANIICVIEYPLGYVPCTTVALVVSLLVRCLLWLPTSVRKSSVVILSDCANKSILLHVLRSCGLFIFYVYLILLQSGGIPFFRFGIHTFRQYIFSLLVDYTSGR